MYSPELTDLATSLTQLVAKSTATAIAAKVRAVKNERDTKILRNAYNEIVNQLLSEREEALQIAQAYKSELEKVVISDEDIRHLHNTVSRILEIMERHQLSEASRFGPEQVEKVKEQVKSYEQIKELISVDTLKTMQLLGFNYKAAIGAPLTLLLQRLILSKMPQQPAFKDVLTSDLVEVLKNKVAFENFKEMTSMG